MSFDYPYTCPDIDRAIQHAKDGLLDRIDDLLSDACPLLTADTRREQASKYLDGFYEAVEDAFEGARKSNESMRKEADRQIESLENEISDLEGRVSYLEREVQP